jgi:hypothetical protein
MTFLGFLILLICAAFLLALPRRFAGVPLLCGYLYMTVGQSLNVGGLSLYAIRVLILVGVVRILVRGEKLSSPLLPLDRAMMAWGVTAILTSFFHQEPVQMFINRGGLVLNQAGIYFLFRCFIQTREDGLAACRWCITCLAPLALLLALERFTLRNPFAILGGVPEFAVQREGRFRAQGPFGNSIDAGLAGAMIIPFAAMMWRRSKTLGWLGVASALGMIFFSASSTPVSALGVICLGLWLWRLRQHLRQMIWAAVIGVTVLAVVMKAPIYFLIARVDFAGGSTGWHRAALIEAAITHFNEWWIVGSDFTRHWMPYGLEGNPYHADITNHYIMNGVIGGVPLLVCLLFTIRYAFRGVVNIYRQAEGRDESQVFLAWALGVTLTAHCTSFIAVNYFDQLLGLWYLHLAIIACFWERPLPLAESAPVRTVAPIPTFLDSLPARATSAQF